MQITKRIIIRLVFLLTINFIFLLYQFKLPLLLKGILLFLLFTFYIIYNIIPKFKREPAIKLKMLTCGCELISCAILCFILEILIYIYLFMNQNVAIILLILNFIVATFLTLLTILNGLIRILSSSRQIKVIWYILLLMLWFIPIVNLIIFYKFCRIAKREYMFELAKFDLNDSRKGSDICNTKYPVMLVHGIFFRDWQIFNYWGRIPNELIKNGAKIYYGSQQSATSIVKSAEELKEQILKAIEDSGYEKINIIAHSKGGLDARYAISCLGMDKYVASLTTINTPHMGCAFVDFILHKVSKKIIQFISKRYNTVFKKLGDINPDFYSGLCDLTVEKCTAFNEEVLDKETILYQCVMSKMKSPFSAGFPLNIGYLFAKHFGGDNDGLVTINSAKYGERELLEIVTVKGRRGVSHGDMIDLMRENIKGFDVREFYVHLVKNLKENNL